MEKAKVKTQNVEIEKKDGVGETIDKVAAAISEKHKKKVALILYIVLIAFIAWLFIAIFLM